jgi:hypothetical protein
MSVQPIPEDRRTATPYLVVADAARALPFGRRRFDEAVRSASPA